MESSDAIQVSIRVRPLNQREVAACGGVGWCFDNKSIIQLNAYGKQIPSNQYTFGFFTFFASFKNRFHQILIFLMFIDHQQSNTSSFWLKQITYLELNQRLNQSMIECANHLLRALLMDSMVR